MATTFNPSDAAAGAFTFLNSNTTAKKQGTASAWQSVRATLARAAGKWFFETTFDLIDGVGGVIVGLMQSNATLASFPGGDTHGVGWQAHNGLTYFNGGLLVNTADVVNQGQTGLIAFDVGNNAWWAFAPTAARYNGSPTANPVTNTGGLSLEGLTPVFPAFGGFFNGGSQPDQVTLNTGRAAFVNATQAGLLIAGGFTPFDTSEPASFTGLLLGL